MSPSILGNGSAPDPAMVGLAEAIRQTLAVSSRQAVIDGIGCLLIDEAGALRYASASDSAAQALEMAEELCVEGPCHEAYAQGDVTIADVQQEARWERLGALLAASPVRTVIGVPVMHGGIPIGAIDAFSALPRVWEDQNFAELHRTAQAVAALIDQALASHLDEDGDVLTAQIRCGIDNQAVLSEAAQVIADASGVTVPRANLRLRQMAAATGLAAPVVARQTLEHGSLPSPAELSMQMDALRRVRGQLATLALSDPLTGLANRVLLLQRLERALTRTGPLAGHPAVIFCDLDRFKTVNDSLGHEIGDEVLRRVGQRMREVVRERDTVARLGGDEFAVLLEDVGSDHEACELAARIATSLAAPITVASPDASSDGDVHHTVTVAGSFGVAVAGREPGASAAGLLRDADMAMYESKRHEPGRVTVFTNGLRDAEHRRMHLELSLRAMLDGRGPSDPLTGGLRLAYQPIVRLADGRLHSVEALVRWDHPELGEVAASELIAIAEAAGLMRPLGASLLHEACRTAAGWRQDHAAKELVLAVNVSALQLDDPGFVAIVDETLAATGLPPDQLCLELTESHLLAAGGAALGALAQLADRGLGLTLDDFGTGYSSLSHLARLPVDKLKIDREFVADLGHDRYATAVAQTVVALARTLDLTTVAEGIETSSQAQQVIDLDCELGQGYLYQRAVTPERIVELIEADVPLTADQD